MVLINSSLIIISYHYSITILSDVLSKKTKKTKNKQKKLFFLASFCLLEFISLYFLYLETCSPGRFSLLIDNISRVILCLHHWVCLESLFSFPREVVKFVAQFYVSFDDLRFFNYICRGNKSTDKIRCLNVFVLLSHHLTGCLKRPFATIIQGHLWRLVSAVPLDPWKINISSCSWCLKLASTTKMGILT